MDIADELPFGFTQESNIKANSERHPQLRTRLKRIFMNHNLLSNRATRRVIFSACASALAMALAASLPAYAGKVETPIVPPELKVDDGNHPFLVGHAIGTQNYVCAPAATNTGVAYVLFTPEATLFNEDGDQLITHFFSPDQNPDDPNKNSAVVAGGTIRAAWVHSRDGSTVWAKLHPNGTVLKDGAIAELLLDKAGTEPGLTGGDILTKTKQIQRLHTTGGLAPAHGCDSRDDVGHTAFSDYTADYFFYTNE